MNKSIILRKALYSEYYKIRKVKYNSFYEEMTMYHKDPNKFLSQDGIQKEQESLINLDGSHYNYVAVCDGEIIGGVTVITEEQNVCYIKILYVSKEFQNKGVGTLIMQFLTTKFTDVQRWYLETPYRSYRNHHFYEKLGFRKVGETEVEEDGFYLFNYARVREI